MANYENATDGTIWERGPNRVFDLLINNSKKSVVISFLLFDSWKMGGMVAKLLFTKPAWIQGIKCTDILNGKLCASKYAATHEGKEI